MSWTPDSELKLKKLWKEGLTGSEIAKFFGTTRSAILGKVHRLKLEARSVSKKNLLSFFKTCISYCIGSMRSTNDRAMH